MGNRLVGRAKRGLTDARDWWHRPLLRVQEAALRAEQVGLALRYRELARSGAELPPLSEVGFRVSSDTDEDGILLYLFAVLGTTDRRFVDIGASSPWGSNTANLIRHHGWTGLLVEADPRTVAATSRAYAHDPDVRYPPRVAHAFVTVENVNGLLREHGMTGEIDLLSIDIDGMDYWVWEAVEAVTPRVVVIEFQDILGPDRAVTVPYSPGFVRAAHAVNAATNDYVGASLAAMVKLGRRKGYRLVGANSMGFNAFFVRDDVVGELLPEVEPKDCLTHPWNAYGEQVRYPRVAGMEWVEV